MNKTKLLTTALAAASIAISGANAAKMEKCSVLNKDGKGLIKEGKGQCGGNGSDHTCAGQNKANDPTAWIMVPEGECAKINMGDVSGVSDDVKNAIELDKLSKIDMKEKAADAAHDMTEKAKDAKHGMKEKIEKKVEEKATEIKNRAKDSIKVPTITTMPKAK